MTRQERFDRQLRVGELLVWCLCGALGGAAIVDMHHMIEDRQRIRDTVFSHADPVPASRDRRPLIAPAGSTGRAGALSPGVSGRGVVIPAGLVSPEPRRKVEVSVYHPKYHGRRTASGARYDHHRGMTAATSRSGRRPVLPFGSVWEVSYRGRTVTVTVTDTGSYRPKRAGYWLDLSGAAWAQLTGGASPSRVIATMKRVRRSTSGGAAPRSVMGANTATPKAWPMADSGAIIGAQTVSASRSNRGGVTLTGTWTSAESALAALDDTLRMWLAMRRAPSALRRTPSHSGALRRIESTRPKGWVEEGPNDLNGWIAMAAKRGLLSTGKKNVC